MELKRLSRNIGTVAFLLLCLGWFLGPGWSTSYRTQSVSLGEDYQIEILAKEAQSGLRTGVEKSFVWAKGDGHTTPFALVQLHGWSATRQEISPVGETLATRMDWNLFMTRLTGHGQDSEAMGRVKATEILQDAEEAYSVGLKMGSKIVLLGTSTGASLSLALADKYPDSIAAMVFISPNFRPKTPTSLLMKGPFGNFMSRYVITTRSWVPKSEEEAKYWTTSYPMTAVHELMDLLSWIDQIDLSKIKIPLLVFYSEKDGVVSVDLIKSKFVGYGGPKKLIEVTEAGHIVAGRVHNPAKTEFVVSEMQKFLKEQGLQP